MPGIFFDPSKLQTRPEDKIVTQPELGLLKQTYSSDDETTSDLPSWTRFIRYVKSLNDAAPENVQYKVLYLTRHGLGFHNIKHAEVGNDEWNVRLPLCASRSWWNKLIDRL